MAVSMCGLRLLTPKIPCASKPKFTNPIVPVLSVTRASISSTPRPVVSSMAYEKELAVAKKAATLAARLCQASHWLSLSLFAFIFCPYHKLFACSGIQMGFVTARIWVFWGSNLTTFWSLNCALIFIFHFFHFQKNL